MSDAAATLDAYARLYETLTRYRLQDVRALATPNVRFKDPFNDVQGVDKMIAAMAMMFDHGEPHFAVLDRTFGTRGGYLLWRYTVDARKPNGLIIDGMTALRFNEAGKIFEHIDHWDAASQLYEHAPVLGPVLRMIKRRFQVRPD